MMPQPSPALPPSAVGPSPVMMHPSNDPQQQQQQQWMMMQHQPQPQFTYQPQQQMQGPPQQMMAPPSMMQAQSPQVQHLQSSAPQNSGEVRTLWIGDLQYWMDETYIYNCFSHTGEVLSVKIIRNKQTLSSEGYGFIEFTSHAAADRVLQSYNGSLMPSADQPFRLNWAAFGMSDRRADGGQDHSIFVGDLSPDVTDQLLEDTFKSRYSSVKGAKVVMDTITGRSKGYGFVRFGEEGERSHAMSEMNGVYCSSRPMRISVATPKKTLGLSQQYTSKGGQVALFS